MTRIVEAPPHPGGTIHGLRSTGYNFNTALADIVDNSVDAKAEKINIKIKMDVAGKILVTVADNGSDHVCEFGPHIGDNIPSRHRIQFN